MISFESDYVAGAHPEVLQRLVDTNAEPLSGYGADAYCASAAEKIKLACGAPDAEVFFVAGGTQTNQLVISTALYNGEGVISARTGHINAHEAGAVEYTGHKVIELPAENGKLAASAVRDFAKTFYGDANHAHMVFPGMVYISYPTEYGTLYSKAELEDLRRVCDEYGMKLYCDGARLAYGLASAAADVTLADFARLCDVFYIGGTKVGALCGEAVVFTKKSAPRRFVTLTKQHGAMLAKGRLIGVQFDALFSNDLYMRIGRHADGLAMKIRAALERKGVEIFIDSPTNQQFAVMDDARLERLSGKAAYGFWEKCADGRTVVRFAAGWSTTEADVEYLESVL